MNERASGELRENRYTYSEMAAGSALVCAG